MVYHKEDSLKQLAVADPQTAEMIIEGLNLKDRPFSSQDVAILVDDTIWGLSEELSFGHAIANGYVSLLGEVDNVQLKKYSNFIRHAGHSGPTFGGIMAKHLVPLIRNGDKILLDHFFEAVDIMTKKGVYVLRLPLETLSGLLVNKEIESAVAYLDLLCSLFSLNLSYNRCKYFSYTIPKAVLSFCPQKRPWQIKQLLRIICLDPDLAESFLGGMDKGLDILAKKALNDFVVCALDKYKKNKKLGTKFLSLESVMGIGFCEQLQEAAVLTDISHQLSRYIRARTQKVLLIRPISSLPEACVIKNMVKPFVCSNGKYLYLPNEISLFPSKRENINLYKSLTKLELGYYEFDSFCFDLEKVKERCDIVCSGPGDVDKNISDMERFFLLFPVRQLAVDLFTIFEHGRLKVETDKRYPGIYRKASLFLQNESKKMVNDNVYNAPVVFLYAWIAIGFLPETFEGDNKRLQSDLKGFADLFNEKIKKDSSVETVGELVFKTYYQMKHVLQKRGYGKKVEDFYLPMQTPFGRRLRPDLFFAAYQDYYKHSERIKLIIEKCGLKVSKSNIVKRLIENNGSFFKEDLKEIVVSLHKNSVDEGMTSHTKLFDLLKNDVNLFCCCSDGDNRVFNHHDETCNVFKYAEWDHSVQDYILDHVRVFESVLPGIEGNYYTDTLNNYEGLVKRIRHSFELLKPQEISILRQWIEGDMFDYRALLDAAVDRKTGKTPSDRLYIKRMKQHRDVAALLLLDFSRSTSNYVSGSNARVIDVEKEAVVFFCEALEIVGDLFSIAGFSGNGRLGVDYFILKAFHEKMNDDIRLRINAITPQRNTRMGAAIRHSVARFENITSAIRLLIIISDGFPNDSGYKKEYAVEDTRRAILEARSKNIHTKALTINLPGDPKLDDIYGDIHHNVISNVVELPDKLLRMYNLLTR